VIGADPLELLRATAPDPVQAQRRDLPNPVAFLVGTGARIAEASSLRVARLGSVSPTPELGLTMPDHRPGADQDHKRTHVLIQGPTGQSPRRRCRSCICSDAFVPTPRNNGLIGSTQVSAGGDNAGMEA
jgi:hypothetical protein